MACLRYWLLLVVAGACNGSPEVRRRLDKEKFTNVTWSGSSKDVTSSLYKELRLNSIKWSEILEAAGVGTVVSERRLIHRKPWCRSQQFHLEVTAPGCRARQIPSRFCYGQCSSFFVPRSGSQFESCPSCRPAKGSWTTPVLFCKGGESRKSLPVYRVKKCKCLDLK